MFKIIYSKRTKKIVSTHHDTSSGTIKQTPEQYLAEFCNDGVDKNIDDFVCIEYTNEKPSQIIHDKHLYNPVTGLIEEDSSYVPPAPVVTPPTE